MNLSLTEDEVRTACDKAAVRISAIEPLPVVGTHVVCVTSEGAELLRQTLGQHLILTKVKRFAFYRVPSSW
ncbi:MAG: hypothetical protein ACK439_10645 [Novosphingobium sp.]|jgi:hypothetical protein